MADPEIPADLIELKRRFLQQEAGLAEIAARMPSSVAVVAGQAEVSPADRDAWDRLWREQGETVLAIRRHPAFEGVTGAARYALDEAAAKAARAAL